MNEPHRELPDPSRSWALLLALLRRLPQGLLSRITGRIADLRLPGFMRGPLIGAFARLAGIDTTEAEAAPAEYPSIGAYFARRLRPGVRSWPADARLPSSPVDGVVGAMGTLESGRILQAKGLDYDAGSLLGDPAAAAAFEGGRFLTIYLSPRHYHRIHTPVAARLDRARAIPGRLLPVNLPAVRTIPELFPTNERLVVMLDAESADGAERPGLRPPSLVGQVALVAVGAFNVGRISAAFDPGWTTNRPPRQRPGPGPETRDYDLRLGPGAELAAFHLGSTVVLLFAPPSDSGASAAPAPPSASAVPPFHPAIQPGADIQLGAPLFDAPDAPAPAEPG